MFLKLIGVVLVVWGIEALIWSALQLYEVLGTAAAGVPLTTTHRVVVAFAMAALKLTLGAYFFFGGAWVTNLAIPGNRPYCAECGYDLAQARSDSCPECGARRPERETL